MRGVEHTAARQSSDRRSELERRDLQVALADGYRDGLTGIPFLALHTNLALGRRDYARGLTREINPGFPSHAGQLRILGDILDTDEIPHVVKINIAGMNQAGQQVYGAMSARLPAAVILAVE